jgi:NAD(P)H-flavin reductase
MRLEGPYFTPANPERYETVICLVAGTGVSGALAIAAAFQAGRADALWSRCVLIWTVRESDFVDLPFITGKKPCSIP